MEVFLPQDHGMVCHVFEHWCASIVSRHCFLLFPLFLYSKLVALLVVACLFPCGSAHSLAVLWLVSSEDSTTISAYSSVCAGAGSSQSQRGGGGQSRRKLDLNGKAKIRCVKETITLTCGLCNLKNLLKQLFAQIWQ